MSLPERVGTLAPPMLILFVVSKIILGIGIGILLARVIPGAGWWLLILGVILSIPPAIKILAAQCGCQAPPPREPGKE